MPVAYIEKKLGTALSDLERFPQYFQIETTSHCNARCIMCDIDEWKREIKVMPDELFNMVVNNLKEHIEDIKTVTIQLGGEPLLDKKLENRIEQLKGIGIRRVVFSTNGSLMNKQRAMSILKSGVDEVYFSIESIDKEVYENIRKNLDFETVMANIGDFIDLRNQLQSRINIRIRSIIMNETKKNIEAFIQYWEQKLDLEKGDRVYAKLIHSFGNQKNLEELEENKELNELPCYALWNSFNILSDGRVVLCCQDLRAQHLLGNINDNTIQEIWTTSYALQKTREQHLKSGRNSIAMCKNCNVWA